MRSKFSRHNSNKFLRLGILNSTAYHNRSTTLELGLPIQTLLPNLQIALGISFHFHTYALDIFVFTCYLLPTYDYDEQHHCSFCLPAKKKHKISILSKNINEKYGFIFYINKTKCVITTE